MNAPPTPSTLISDNRGAVMVIGVFMSAFLVGMLWYIVGIGDAILYRERLQDGADAVAFASAVYHARGMNIIAMINIIMAAILGILVAFKLVQLMNTIAMAISCALAATGYGAAVFGPICTFTGNLVSPIQKAVNIAQKLVDTALPILSKTQVGIAVAMPWVAEGKSVYVATQYYKEPVKGGGMLSVSLIPSNPRLGLPVQEDDYAFLCKKAGQFVGEVVFSPFGPFKGFVGKVVGGLAGTFPGYFCGSSGGGGGGSGGGGGNVSQKSVDDVVKKGCEDKKASLPPKKKKKFDMKDCIEDGKKAVADKLKNTDTSGGTTSSNTNNKTSKRVYDEAENGDGYFQIWSIVVGNQKWPQYADKGVQIAAWNKDFVAPPAPWGQAGIAQAEFYYDTSGEWEDYKEDAMWNMRWRARLRRLHTPEEAASFMSDVASVLGGKVDGDVFNSPAVGALILGTSSASSFEDMFKNVLGGGANLNPGYQRNPKLYDWTGITVIH